MTNGAGFITSSGTAKTISDTLPLTLGGTGSTTASGARTNLGLGGAATYSTTTSVTSGSSALVTSGGVYSKLSGVTASSVFQWKDVNITINLSPNAESYNQSVNIASYIPSGYTVFGINGFGFTTGSGWTNVNIYQLLPNGTNKTLTYGVKNLSSANVSATLKVCIVMVKSSFIV